MSGVLTPYGRGQILTAYFRHDLFSPPAAVYLAYTVSVPDSNADGTTIDEPTGLARTSLGALTSANWGPTGFSEMYNLNQITPPACTAAIPILSGWAVLDASGVATGNAIAVGELLEPFGLTSGQAPPPVDIGGLAFGIYD